MSGFQSNANEFAQFRKTFFEECAEILADMEERLVKVQAGVVDREELNAIFRAAHSIKAGAGAFGFGQLVEFCHTYEALLDWLRDGRIEQDEKVSDVLIRARDVLTALVEAAQEDRTMPPDFGSDVAAELQDLLDEAGGASGGAKAQKAKAAAPVAAQPTGPSTYRISFKPHAELFRHANEPLLLIRELKHLGTLTAECDQSRLPVFNALDPEDAYLAWTFELVTDKPKDAIAEVFEFVDQDCDLTIELISAPEASAGEPVVEAPSIAPEPTPAVDDRKMPAAAAASTAAAPAATGKASAVSSIRVDLSRVDRLVNMVGELVIAQAMLAQQIADQAEGRGGLAWTQGQEDLALHTRELQECVMAIRMQPVKSVFSRMPRLVRDVAAKVNKKVRLVMSGEQTEVDKTVIEELADPLTHMIRNSIDHGIEDGETRKAKGKPEEGTIELAASHRGGNILITISDDGAGLNRERLLKKAVEKGIIAPGASLSDEEIDNLIFAPGFSTAEAVTDLSGRGVGMDVVRRNISNLGGRIQLSSTPGKGTRFTMVLPLTLAVLDGMLVAVGKEKYILPLTSIVESIRPDQKQLRTVIGGGQVVSIRGEYIRLIYLYRIFDVSHAVTDPSKALIVLVETENGSKVGIVVDELIGQQQVVIKSLQDNFDPVGGISGATILGNGKVALILDIEQLTTMAERRGAEPTLIEATPAVASEGQETAASREHAPSDHCSLSAN